MTLTKIWTTIGLQKQINCLLNGDNFSIKYIAVGDGSGAVPSPAADDTALVNEVWRGEITELNEDAPQFTAITYIPEDEGDFVIRELGVFDEDDNLLFVSQMDETPKKSTSSGLVKQIGLKVVFELQNGLNAVIVDPTLNVAASTAYVDTVAANYQLLEEKGVAGGYASLGDDGLVPESQLPDSLGSVANQDLSNLTDAGENKLNYNVFCINTGEITDEGEPAWLDVAQNIVIESDFDSEGISDLKINNSVYFDNVTDYGDYIFTYDGSAWSLSYDETEDSEVDLSDYGISFTELFSIASSISSDTITDVSVNDNTFLSTVNNTAGTYYFYSNVDTTADVTVDYTSDTITDVTADESFYTDYTEETEITLTYDGSDWLLDNTAVDLSDYGITIEGEATDGDTITVTIISDTAATWLLSGDEVLLDDYGITYEGEASNGNIIVVTVTSLIVSGDTITVTVYSPSDDTVEQSYYFTTSGEFDVTTAAGKTYTISDTLTLDISDYEDGTYNVYVNPVDLSLNVIANSITSGITFPDDAADGDYLLNTAKIPYDLQQINITTDEDTEETTTTITTGLNEVHAGTLTVGDGVTCQMNNYNENILTDNLYDEITDMLTSSGSGLATYSNASNGYYKFSNGLIVAWGRNSSSSSYTATPTVSLPVAFSSSTSYKVIETLYNTSTSDRIATYITAQTTTTFTARLSRIESTSGGTRYVQFLAIGY